MPYATAELASLHNVLATFDTLGGFDVPTSCAFNTQPLLVWVTGKPGSGKTTRAQRLAARDMLGLPILDWDRVGAGSC